MMGQKTFDAQIEAGNAKLVGNRKAYEQLKSTLVHFELLFEIMPGTKKAGRIASKKKPFETGDPTVRGE